MILSEFEALDAFYPDRAELYRDNTRTDWDYDLRRTSFLHEWGIIQEWLGTLNKPLPPVSRLLHLCSGNAAVSSALLELFSLKSSRLTVVDKDPQAILSHSCRLPAVEALAESVEVFFDHHQASAPYDGVIGINVPPEVVVHTVWALEKLEGFFSRSCVALLTILQHESTFGQWNEQKLVQEGINRILKRKTLIATKTWKEFDDKDILEYVRTGYHIQLSE